GFGGFYAGADPEPNAAMPSLHVAVPMLIACAAIGKASRHRRLAWLWMLYPLTIGFGVVYLGEHYVAGTVIGLALGALCYVVVDRLVDRFGKTTRAATPLVSATSVAAADEFAAGGAS